MARRPARTVTELESAPAAGRPAKSSDPRPEETTIPVIRTTVNLSPEAANALKEIAADRHTTVADVIRRAIWIEKYLHDAMKQGGKVLVQDQEHGVRELIIR